MRLRYLCLLTLFISGCTNFRPPSLETLNGEWRFAYVQKAKSLFGENPTPPSFDTIEFKKDGNIRLHDSLMNREFNGSYSLIGDKLTWTFSPPDMKNPVKHQLECFWTDYGCALALRAAKGSGGDPMETEWVYYRPEVFLSTDDIAGKWVTTIDGKNADMTFGKDGKYHINGKEIWGFYRLWPSKYGNVLTTVIWIQGEGGFMLLNLYKIEVDKLTLTPLIWSGPDKRGEKEWNRSKENEGPNNAIERDSIPIAR